MSFSVLLASNLPRSIFNRRNIISCYSTPSSSSSSPESTNDIPSFIRYPDQGGNNENIIHSLSGHRPSTVQPLHLITATNTSVGTNEMNGVQFDSKNDCSMPNEGKEEDDENLKVNTLNHDTVSSSMSLSQSSHNHQLTSALGCGGEVSDVWPHNHSMSQNNSSSQHQPHHSSNTVTPTSTATSTTTTATIEAKDFIETGISFIQNVTNELATSTTTTSSSSTSTIDALSLEKINTPVNTTTVLLYNDPDYIPQRYIDGCEGNMKEAKRRWEETKKWRQEQHVEEILTESQPHYFTIKAFYPNYHCGHSKDGRLVYYERPGGINISEMKKRGVTVDDMFRHWLFLTEYQFRVLLHDDETAKTISIFDVENINTSFLTGDPYHYFKKTVTAANHHYVERSYCIFIINAPLIMNMIWTACKQFIHPNSQKKVRILSKKDTLSGLQEFIDLEQIPDYYGGLLTCLRPENVPPTVIPTSSTTPLLMIISSSLSSSIINSSNVNSNSSSNNKDSTNTVNSKTDHDNNDNTNIINNNANRKTTTIKTTATITTANATTTNANTTTNNTNSAITTVSSQDLLTAELVKMQAIVDKDNCRFYSPETLQLNQYVRELNRMNGTVDPFDPWLLEEAVKKSLSLANAAIASSDIAAAAEDGKNVSSLKQQQQDVKDEQYDEGS